jgi:methylase of polypeptide subunit release factors
VVFDPPANALLQWVLGASTTTPLDEKWVPGATDEERRSLTALGGVVRELLRDQVAHGYPQPVQDWLADAPMPPAEVVSEARELIAQSPDTRLAQFYSLLVRSDHRRALGTFFTPPPEVELMLDLWDASQPVPGAVVDIGAGVGVFTASAAERWPGAQVFAVDVNPVTLGLLALRIAATATAGPEALTARVSLICDDYVDWVQNSWSDLPARRLILGNPPFTRQQLLPAEVRERLHTAAGGLCGRRASLSSLMTAVSLRQLDPEDGLCLLLPAQWLESDYAAGLRRHLWQASQRRVELRLVESSMFRDARVDAIALLVGVEGKQPAEFTVGTWRSSQPRTVDRTGEVPVSWRGLFETADRVQSTTATTKRSRRVSSIDSTDGAASSAVLGAVADVRRGVATGHNEFFVISDDVQAEHLVPWSALYPVVRRLAPLPDRLVLRDLDKLDGSEPRWLLVADSRSRAQSVRLDRYLAYGEEIGVPDRELCSRREVWHDLDHDVFIPDVIIGSMSRDNFRIIENAAGAVITNNLYGWVWKDDVPRARQVRLLAWLRSDDGQDALRRVARRQADRLLKLEPGALKSLPVPDDL